jgi:release factor glutamine methyltransferase
MLFLNMAINVQTIGDFRKYLSGKLAAVYPPEESDAICTSVIKTITGAGRLQQLSWPGKNISGDELGKLLAMAEELSAGKPLQYVTGETEFAGCVIKVNKFTLIPRPETEELVGLISKELPSGFMGSVNEYATGSGCIAVAVAKRFPAATVTGSDVSEEALKIAAENAGINGVRVDFRIFDLCSGELPSCKSDIIICNPPYVSESEKSEMHRNVLEFEPHSALFVPDADPMVFYRRLAEIAGYELKPGGTLWLEINERFGRETAEIFLQKGFQNCTVIKDINGKDRFLKVLKNER